MTAWSRVLLDQLTRLQLVKKLPAFYGTCKFTTTFTRALHLSGPSLRLCNLVNKHVWLFSQPALGWLKFSSLYYKRTNGQGFGCPNSRWQNRVRALSFHLVLCPAWGATPRAHFYGELLLTTCPTHSHSYKK